MNKTLSTASDLNVYLREGERPGTAEIILANEDGQQAVITLNPRKVRAWTAKLADITTREN